MREPQGAPFNEENLQKLSEYKKMKGIWNIIRTVDTPVHYDKDNDVSYEGKLYLKEAKTSITVAMYFIIIDPEEGHII